MLQTHDFPDLVEQLELGVGRDEPKWHVSFGFPATVLLGLALASLIHTFTILGHTEHHMAQTPQIGFGDNVRVRATPDTEGRGLAGLVGQVYGFTTPSVTGVSVIGQLVDDLAFNVHFDDRKETVWFIPELLELVDHGAGTEIRVGRVPKSWVRSEAGEWIEKPDKKP